MTSLDEQVAENLRRIYRETADEPVPDRFQALLEQLREQDRQASDGDDGTDAGETDK